VFEIHPIHPNDIVEQCPILLTYELYDASYGFDGVGLKQEYMRAIDSGQSPLNAMWVAYMGRYPVGVATVQYLGAEPVLNVYVSEAYRRRGLGKQLIDLAKGYLPQVAMYYTQTSANLGFTLGVPMAQQQLEERQARQANPR
jgi:GNAT superfamily N-acetyltransferase